MAVAELLAEIAKPEYSGKMLLGVMADRDVPEVMFDAKPILIADLFDSLLALDIVNKTKNIWLTDLGVRSWTTGRRVYDRDVTEADLTAVRELVPMADKVTARRDELAQKHAKELADLQEAHDELQKRDGELRPIGDKKYKTKWEG